MKHEDSPQIALKQLPKEVRYAFRRKARILALEIGISDAADRLGINRDLLTSWVRRPVKPTGMRPKTPEGRALLKAEREIEKLKRELQKEKQANFILREIASFFSVDPSENDSNGSENLPSESKKKPSKKISG